MRKIFSLGVVCLTFITCSVTLSYAGDEELSVAGDDVAADTGGATPAGMGEDSSTYVEESIPQDSGSVDVNVESVPDSQIPPQYLPEEDQSASSSQPLPTESVEPVPLIKRDTVWGDLAYLLNGDPNIAVAPSYGFSFSPAGVKWGSQENQYFQITGIKATPLEAGNQVSSVAVFLSGIW